MVLTALEGSWVQLGDGCDVCSVSHGEDLHPGG